MQIALIYMMHIIAAVELSCSALSLAYAHTATISIHPRQA